MDNQTLVRPAPRTGVSFDARPEAAEAIGTFLMVLVGGAAVVTHQSLLVVSLAFGGTVMVMIQALGHLSGAHFNPAITLAFAATGHFPWRRIASYILAQAAGAVAACLALAMAFPIAPLVAHGSMTGAPAFFVEALATLLLGFVIIAVATDARTPAGMAGIAIGATVALGALAAGPLTGAAMNPARALAPAALANDFGSLAVHIAGPFVGGTLGMLAYESLRRGTRPKAEAILGSAGPIDLEAKA